MNMDSMMQEWQMMRSRPEQMQLIVYGKYNHGKSSLLNALCQQEQFQVGDVRLTRRLKKLDWQGMILIDTPGLDADAKDEAEAQNALQQSDLILMVHSLKEGELDQNEKELIHALHQQDHLLWLILTQSDQVESVQSIQKVIAKQIPSSIPIWVVSSTRAFHPRAEIQKQSGIDALRKQLIEQKKAILEHRRQKIKALRQSVEDHIKSQIRDLKIQYDQQSARLNQLKDQWQSDRRLIQNKENELNRL